MRLDLSAEHRALRESVREFAEAVVKPAAAEIDSQHRFPTEIIAQAAELDLMGILIPADYGGAGLDHLGFAICIEELARACASTAVIVDVHNSVAAEPILLFGSEEQKHEWLPALSRGDVLGAFALTEPASGSDAASLKATARRHGGEYVLSGSKVFITNIGVAGVYVVFARTGSDPRAGGISAFLVPGNSEGLRVGQVFDKMGLNGSPTGELVLEEVRVPATALLGAEGAGFSIAMRALDSGRIGISGQALGIGGVALEEAIAYTGDRSQFGAPISSFQAIGFMLADMATRQLAAGQMTYHAAALCSAGQPFTKEASMAKLFATDTAMEIALDALQLAGGYGYTRELPFERHVRDAKALQIYEGSNQIQRVVVAREILRSA